MTEYMDRPGADTTGTQNSRDNFKIRCLITEYSVSVTILSLVNVKTVTIDCSTVSARTTLGDTEVVSDCTDS